MKPEVRAILYTFVLGFLFVYIAIQLVEHYNADSISGWVLLGEWELAIGALAGTVSSYLDFCQKKRGAAILLITAIFIVLNGIIMVIVG